MKKYEFVLPFNADAVFQSDTKALKMDIETVYKRVANNKRFYRSFRKDVDMADYLSLLTLSGKGINPLRDAIGSPLNFRSGIPIVRLAVGVLLFGLSF